MDILKYYKIINVHNNFSKKLFLDIHYKNNKIKKFIVRDGFVKIFYNLDQLYCNYCRSNECYHIYFIFNEFYKIQSNVIPFIFCSKFEYSFQNFDLNEFYKYTLKYLESLECCYCLDELSKKCELWKCNNCKNLIHQKCINEWIKQKNDCPLCKQVINSSPFF